MISHVGIGVDRQGPLGNAGITRGRIDGHLLQSLRPGEVPRFDQFGHDQPQGRLQPDDAEGGLVEFLHFLFLGVGRVVGNDAVDRAVLQPLDAGLDVPRAAQGGFIL